MRTMTEHRPHPEPPGPDHRRAWVSLWYLTCGLTTAAMALYIFTAISADDPATTPAPAPVPAAPSTPAVDQAAVPTPDWPALVGQLLSFDARLRAHPDPAAVDLFMTPDHPDYAVTVAAQRRLLAGEVRYDPTPGAPVLGRVADQGEVAGERVLLVEFTTPRYRLVDAAGVVVVDTPARSVNATWRLRYEDGRWRIAGVGA